MGIKWTRKRRADAQDAPEQRPAPVPPADVDRLVRELIVLADLATGPAVALQVRRVLAVLQIDEVSPGVGTVFDAEEHHVVATEPASDRAAGQIVEVVRPGWARHGTLLRPAEVSVATEPGASMPS